MAEPFTGWLVVACFAMAAAGCSYAIAAAWMVRRFAGQSGPAPVSFTGVTILKPLNGAQPSLHDNLTSFCEQDYSGPVQILFGVQDPADPAIPIVRRLIADNPERDLELVVHGPSSAPNPKVGNIAGLESRIRHEVVVLADADIAVTPDYLTRIVAALAVRTVGAVTCLYRGIAERGVWSELMRMGIDYRFLPDVVAGLELGLARPCFGSTIALRRETLAAIGGFGAFARHLADDYAIGAAVRAEGLTVALAPLVLAHSCTEASAADLLRHELRWARTVRAVIPLGYAGSIVTHPLPFALAGSALAGFSMPGLGVVAAAIACRLVLQAQVDHTLHVRSMRGWWLMPARDLFSFGIFIASFFVDVVTWHDRRYRVCADGTLTRVGGLNA